MILPHEPPKNRDLKAFVTSAYFYPTSKSLGSNALALVMSMNLGQFKQDYLEIQSGKPMDSTEIVIWAKNGTHSRLVSTPYIRVTPHDNCQMITVFATVQLIPNVKNILLISDDGSTEVPFTLPDYQKRDLVVCWSPLYVTEQWQNFILAMHIYKKFGGFVHIYLISCISSLFALMKKYESAGYLKIQPWYRVNFPFIHPLHVDPYVGIELQNQASSHTDCLLQYKESAEFITFLDMDEILIPRSAPSYVEEFQKILNKREQISHIEFSIENYKMSVARDSLKFSIPQMLATLKYTYSTENSRKIVAIPRNLNFTWIYPVPTHSNGMRFLRTDENVITKLKTIKWTNPKFKTDNFPLPLYLNTTEFLILGDQVEQIEDDFQQITEKFETNLILPDLPNQLYYYNDVKTCLAKTYHSFLNSVIYGSVKCPGPQMCKFKKYRDVKCVHKWNVILARQAHETANKCGYEPFFQPNFGENVYAPSSSNPFKNLDDIGASAMAEWVDDVSWYTWKSLKINENPAKLRRFSQMIRDETSLVGCGLKDCGKTNGYYKYVVVCKYDPP
ncbi:hypothetical protein B9Z55_017933 [Caenorhabditis nigoni]|uniref:Glycosyltransferase family 92 protein n=2 Tax=Caenorhabditis nigoni TaxID=1611254 RepID=A0A2G5TBZ1_9PELO|nr:hypothetical protein B9Z55_017933 [Caenorhabditis nigoni]